MTTEEKRKGVAFQSIITRLIDDIILNYFLFTPFALATEALA